MQKFWLVWSPTGHISPSKRHPSESQARAEAERLARNSNGEFYVVEAKSVARRSVVRTENLG